MQSSKVVKSNLNGERIIPQESEIPYVSTTTWKDIFEMKLSWHNNNNKTKRLNEFVAVLFYVFVRYSF